MAEGPSWLDPSWLDQTQEAPLEAALPIIDPHHHLWDYPKGPSGRYLLDEVLADTGTGHNVVATVFVECGSMYRAAGPESLQLDQLGVKSCLLPQVPQGRRSAG